MSKILSLLIPVFLAGSALGVSGFDATLFVEPPLLREGFILRGIDGRLSGPDSNDAWFFELAADVNDYRAVAKAGTKLQMLPSSTLEKMIADGRNRSQMTFRLWNGRITKYKSRNYIFPGFFLPVREAKKDEHPVEGVSPSNRGQDAPDVIETWPGREKKSAPAIRDPNDVLTIPSDLFEKLQATREVMAARERPIVDSNKAPAVEPNLPSKGRRQIKQYSGYSDTVFVNRTGFIVADDAGGFVFELDAFGRNARKRSLRLLPCAMLELAELKVKADFEPVRFRVAGILTRYEDTEYLLLQKAVPTYSHGNFGR